MWLHRKPQNTFMQKFNFETNPEVKSTPIHPVHWSRPVIVDSLCVTKLNGDA